MIRLQELWDGGPDQGSPVEGTVCDECGRQGFGTDLLYVRELDEVLCNNCIMEPLIQDVIDKKGLTGEDQIDYLCQLEEVMFDENPQINEIRDGVYVFEDTPDYEMTQNDVINTLMQELSDSLPDLTELEKAFPDYDFVPVETEYK